MQRYELKHAALRARSLHDGGFRTGESKNSLEPGHLQDFANSRADVVQPNFAATSSNMAVDLNQTVQTGAAKNVDRIKIDVQRVALKAFADWHKLS